MIEPGTRVKSLWDGRLGESKYMFDPTRWTDLIIKWDDGTQTKEVWGCDVVLA